MLSHSTHAIARSLLLGALGLVLTASGASAASLALTVSQNSLCFTGDVNDDVSSPVAYDPGHESCYDGGVNDLNIFVMSHAISGGGSSSVSLDVNAAVAVDANPASSEYQAGRISFGLTLEISGTGGGDWELQIDQQMMGLLALVDDGAGNANAGTTGVSASLDVAPSLDFGTSTTISSADSTTEAFSVTRLGDTISGTGDTTITGTLEVTLDAYSECGGFFCFGWADEGAVLFGIDDASGDALVSVDEYATHGRAVEPDGYQLTFSLLADPICGDGNVDASLGEECDDGNQQDEDGCSALCIVEYCGDSVTQAAMGETCDDGNLVGGDGCSALCQTEGVVEVPSLRGSRQVVLALVLISLGVLALYLRRSSRRRA